LSLVPTKVLFEDGNIFYLKRCHEHGNQKTLISTDIDYYKWCKDSVGPSYLPQVFQKEFEKGCPYDCGLCRDHEQHSCMAILEIIDDCNMRCPTCIAGSFPGAGNGKSIEEIERMLDTIVESEGQPDLVMVSGGEPTIHPQILEILRRVKERPIKHFMLITNGRLIASDKAFVSQLEQYKEQFEVYLQFDSLRANVLLDIRGEDLRDTRKRAIENLESAGIATTLVCVVKNGLNDDELGEIIDFALQFKCIRGVTLQPVKASGRNETLKNTHYITLSETRTRILEQFPRLRPIDMRPHPCNPENISIGYLIRRADGVVPITELLFEESVQSNEDGSLFFDNTAALKSMMYFLPQLNTSSVKYDDLFRVTIVSFLDQFNFSVDAARRSCIHFVTPEKQIIPLDTYYLLYAQRLSQPIQLSPTVKLSDLRPQQ